MGNKCILLLIFNYIGFVYGSGLAGPNGDKVIVCHYTGWGEGAGKLEVFDIEPSLCTHLVYCFAGIDENSYKIMVVDRWRDVEKDGGGFKQFVDLKEKNKRLKTTIAIGGWDEGSEKYSRMAADAQLRNIFIRSVVNFLDIYKFDGLDLHWEYPTGRGGKQEDKDNYVTLIKELSEAFEPKGYLLTGAIRTNINDIDNIYDLVNVNFYLDFVHIVAYDYHGPWDGVVGANAPIRGRDKDDYLNLESMIQYLISRGLTASKMVLGLPMYGHTYILKNATVKNVVFGETETETNGFSGPFSAADGFMGYNEICRELSNKSSEWIQYWDEHTRTPYLRDDGRFIAYDNPRSIANKVQFALDYNLGGFFIWHLSNDDFRGNCDEDTSTYKDFIERFNRISDQPKFKEALNILSQVGSNNEFYTISDNKPRLRLPKPKFSNYPLLRTVNEAIDLALEEKKVLEEMKRIESGKENRESKFPCVRTCTEVCYYGVYGKAP